MKLQAQAVLQRLDLQAPLRLAGVLVAGSFYPLTAQDAWGPLHLEVGLVALAPLTPVQATDVQDGAGSALAEARNQWSNVTAPMGDLLKWRPIDEVRDVDVGESVAALIAKMTDANDVRRASVPSTPPYHGAARELERLASLVYETTSTGERIAEERARRKRDLPIRIPNAPARAPVVEDGV